MAFGKRRQEPAREEKRPGREAEAGPPPTPPLEALRNELRRLMEDAGRIAEAVRAEQAVVMPVLLDEPDAEAGPLHLKGFHTHFNRTENGQLVHAVFAYRQPTTGENIDPNAQFHLSQLTGRAMEFNLFCQRAHLDEALGVALQSPNVPDMVDAILVPAAFFTAFFDNMLAMQPGVDGAVPLPDLREQRANLDRHLLMAADKMLAPGRLPALLPFKGWPFIGAEVLMAPHDGDYFINGVYFPAEHARLLLEIEKPEASVAA